MSQSETWGTTCGLAESISDLCEFSSNTCQQGLAARATGERTHFFFQTAVDGLPGRIGAVPARQVSLSGHLLATSEAVGGAGHVARCIARAAGRARWQRATEVGGDVSGRQLRSGEKGGSAVGKTKRGKGTKWMALVDGQGLPLGVRLGSVSQRDTPIKPARC